jgi:hypothetical protein
VRRVVGLSGSVRREAEKRGCVRREKERKWKEGREDNRWGRTDQKKEKEDGREKSRSCTVTGNLPCTVKKNRPICSKIV